MAVCESGACSTVSPASKRSHKALLHNNPCTANPRWSEASDSPHSSALSRAPVIDHTFRRGAENPRLSSLHFSALLLDWLHLRIAERTPTSSCASPSGGPTAALSSVAAKPTRASPRLLALSGSGAFVSFLSFVECRSQGCVELRLW